MGDLCIDKQSERYLTLKRDIENKQSSGFSLVYQPKIDLKNKNVISWEVLSRWNHNELGNIPPLEFIKIIKEMGKEYEFDMFVFEEMCRHIGKVNCPTNTYSINMSTNTLQNKQIYEDILYISSKYNINPRSIIFEIVETADVEKYETIEQTINDLEKMGYSISIDDFGTGYSSYYRLLNMNFKEIKIPKEFLPSSRHNNDKQIKILKSIVSMGKNLGCEIVIEGIETEEHHNLAVELGIDYAQGYLYSHPVPFKEYTKVVSNF